MTVKRISELPIICKYGLYACRGKLDLNTPIDIYIDRYTSIIIDNVVYAKDEYMSPNYWNDLTDYRKVAIAHAVIKNYMIIKNRYGNYNPLYNE